MTKTRDMTPEQLFNDIVVNVGQKYVVYQSQLPGLIEVVKSHKVLSLKVDYLTNSELAEVELVADTAAVLASLDLA
jgi:hypothetical protein